MNGQLLNDMASVLSNHAESIKALSQAIDMLRDDFGVLEKRINLIEELVSSIVDDLSGDQAN